MTSEDKTTLTSTDNWQLLHQDDDILVVNKPPGMLSVPGKIPEPSLFDLVTAQFPFSKIVHRLDMQTSGIILFARHGQAQSHLMQQFEKKTTSKSYLALVAGKLPAATGTIDLPLLCDWPNRPKQHVTPDGKPSQTHWRLIESYEYNDLDGDHNQPGQVISKVELTPITGRSHQLRVHMASLGHPILGDHFYAPELIRTLTPRLCLHAQTLGFTHPTSGERMMFSLPAAF